MPTSDRVYLFVQKAKTLFIMPPDEFRAGGAVRAILTRSRSRAPEAAHADQAPLDARLREVNMASMQRQSI